MKYLYVNARRGGGIKVKTENEIQFQSNGEVSSIGCDERFPVSRCDVSRADRGLQNFRVATATLEHE